MRTLSSLLRRHVVTESGKKLGRCHDIRAEVHPRSLQVTGICVGRFGLAEHFGLRAHSKHDFIPWKSIVRIEGKRIVVRDDAS